MSMLEIKIMMQEIAEHYTFVKGRKWNANDKTVMECIMQVYCQTAEIDHEEIRFLWENYLQKGILDFPTAMKMARKRIA